MTYNEKILNELNDVLDKLNPDTPENTYYEEEPTVILLNELYKIAQDKVNKIIEKYKLDESVQSKLTEARQEEILNKLSKKKLNEYTEGTDFEKYTRLVNEIKVRAEDGGYIVTDKQAESIADRMSDDGFFYDYELPDDFDDEKWEEIHNIIDSYLIENDLDESEKQTLKEEDIKSEYNKYCNDLGIDPNKKSSKNRFMKDYAKNYTTMNGIKDLESKLADVKKELNEVSSAQAEFLYNQQKRKEYEKEQSEIRRADKVSMLQTMINGLKEHLWDLGLRYFPGNAVHKIYTTDDDKLYDSCTISESDLVEKLTKLEKFLREVIDKREAEIGNVNESEQLNESSDYELTSPSGKFWIGDPCYVLSDDVYYGVWNDKYNFKDGKIDTDDTLSFIVHGTAYGDGAYEGSNGFTYGVDSGTLAVIPIELVAKEDGISLGTIETGNKVEFDYIEGTFKFDIDGKTIKIDTDI